MTFDSVTEIIRKILLYISILSAIISAFLIIGIIWLLLKAKWFKDLFTTDFIEFLTFKPYGVARAKKIWEKILKRAETGLESETKLAIIEAEDLLDDVLERLGYKGESFGERIKSISKEILPNIERVFEAHQIHNNIIHDPNYRLDLERARSVIEIYQKALQDLEVF